MKKIKARANAALIFAALTIAGLVIFAVRLIPNASAWAMFPANSSVYNSGVLDTGTLTDRDDLILAKASDGVYRYADDSATRIASLHTVGDYSGNIGTGALSYFAAELSGYSLINGTYSRTGEGRTVALTIDAGLNVTAYNALAGRRGAVLVMNYETGEMLCMVSSPSYDPVSPPDLTQPQYEGAYINRAISSVYTPGSVFKIVTLCAAIENITGLDSRVFFCEGYTTVENTRINCSGTHGQQTIEQAFANSCNVAFAELSLELGADTLAKYADSLGLTSEHTLSGIPTAEGSFDKHPDGSAELAWSGIGQSNDLVSPYALLRLSAAIAGDGSLTEPTLLSRSRLASLSATRLVKEQTAVKLSEMMSYNVTYGYGAGSFPGLDLCAKTGTAETGSGTSHSWFTGFLRDENNPLAFAVIVENGGGGLAAAGQVANTVLQAAID